MNQKQEYPFSLDMFGLEAKVRGLYLTIACDFEKIMSDIIVKCEEPDGSKREALRLKIAFEMGKKLKRCEQELLKYNSAYYNHFIPQFEAIKELLKYRNMLAHGFSQYDPQKIDKSFITFIWVEKGKERIDNINVKPFIKNILHFRDHISLFYTLHAKICEERGND